jgi:predicted mannosyl-3-phosphoglycerate phosphatase (HAD superfamily)
MNEAEDSRLYGLMEVAEGQQAAVQVALEGLAAERAALRREREALAWRDARLRHAKGARQLRHRGPVHLGRGAREAAPGAEEQQHDGKAQPVSPMLGLD